MPKALLDIQKIMILLTFKRLRSGRAFELVLEDGWIGRRGLWCLWILPVLLQIGLEQEDEKWLPDARLLRVQHRRLGRQSHRQCRLSMNILSELSQGSAALSLY